MVAQEEQSPKRTSAEALINEVANAVRKRPKRTRFIRRQKPLNSTILGGSEGGEHLTRPDYSEDDEDAATLKRETDFPVLPTRASTQRLSRASGTSCTTSTTDITSLSLPATNGSACAGCGSSSHRLNICMKAGSVTGLMKGCPWCNTLNHSLANCSDTKHDLAMLLEAIQMRANMPFFLPTQGWVHVVRAAVADGHKPPNSFPWTTGFTKKIYKSAESFQGDLDKVGTNRRVGLPIDPSTKDWETVQRNFPEAT
ncbi:uncharacterized protein FTJAE_4245 [Fusarium tjaetaba]|uniref:Uncharacterized protein n=1 Tax=Fusarium tjaetaba TaxID=1567544 RepID=A0A8H5RXV0_9HYPO|nr:uncharacterized protein FTJAE_4245 [Fusarium tjaetaba]KAF5641063.1 hypothetical protein FTJAE_4245 [Fusarium tjaetaba]